MSWNEKPKQNPEHKKNMTIYCPHDDKGNYVNIDSNYIQIVSIDPGCKNFCIRIERRYNNNETCELHAENIEIKDVEIKDEDNFVFCCTYSNLFNYLDKYIELFKECHYFLIERQLQINHQATAVMTSVMSYFSLLLRNNSLHSLIYVISPKLKNKVLFPGVKTTVSKLELKRMSIERATFILILRGDTNGLIKLYSSPKMDDLADVICQSEAFCISRDHGNITRNQLVTIWNERSIDIENYKNMILGSKKLSKKDKILEIMKNVETIYKNTLKLD